MGAHRHWTAKNAWTPRSRCDRTEPPQLAVRPSQHALARLRLPAFDGKTVPCSRSLGSDAVRGVNHTVSLCICESAQHGFVGQAWAGRVVGLRPTRRPLRLSRPVPAHG